ncbi:hypothetical protein [Peribacillus kribbensis]|uniref:hypothetical protein n=1 Tax=Peribacillus kribbensis TaxID=356658 RepID=UPI0003FD20F0|nr:hypothetical protein [Peribacillus kribbensis]
MFTVSPPFHLVLDTKRPQKSFCGRKKAAGRHLPDGTKRPLDYLPAAVVYEHE